MELQLSTLVLVILDLKILEVYKTVVVWSVVWINLEFVCS